MEKIGYRTGMSGACGALERCVGVEHRCGV